MSENTHDGQPPGHGTTTWWHCLACGKRGAASHVKGAFEPAIEDAVVASHRELSPACAASGQAKFSVMTPVLPPSDLVPSNE